MYEWIGLVVVVDEELCERMREFVLCVVLRSSSFSIMRSSGVEVLLLPLPGSVLLRG